ncbi:hypothetical protein PoB_003222100 [Plakobranchus ocellatus]|uniref:Uncharacterized protein n=1 Tax=Plakobranchus ocellatus TaxID=259542 RepID=A0AAV4AGF8_9GAST|nr:hypothetical protein PoB_003222100 [Plakobranchus ocellatus]
MGRPILRKELVARTDPDVIKDIIANSHEYVGEVLLVVKFVGNGIHRPFVIFTARKGKVVVFEAAVDGAAHVKSRDELAFGFT